MQTQTDLFNATKERMRSLDDSGVEPKSHSQYVGFHLGDEEFLANIVDIQEIRMLPTITYVPRCIELIEGIINLRGEIIPAINLRRFLGLDRAERTPMTRMVIVGSEAIRAGFIVDEITRVFPLDDDDIQNVPSIFSSIALSYLSGISRSNGRVNAIIDVEKMLTAVTQVVLGSGETA